MKKKMRRLLSMILTLMMFVSVVPVNVSAAGIIEDNTVYKTGQLYLDKTATLEDDGTYTIHLEALATGTPVTTEIVSGKPLDILFVLDQSGSLVTNGYYDALQDSIESFLDSVVQNGSTIGKTHRVAFVGFASAEVEEVITPSINNGSANHKFLYADGTRYDHWTNTGIYLNDGTFKSYKSYDLVPIERADLNTQNFEYAYSGSTYQDYLPIYYAQVNQEGNVNDGVIRPILYSSSSSIGWYFDSRDTFSSSSSWEKVSSYDNDELKFFMRPSDSFTSLTSYDYSHTFMPVTDGPAGEGNKTEAMIKIVDHLGASGATRPGTGMEMARKLLEYNPLSEEDLAEGRERIVVVFTDGVPGRTGFEEAEAELAFKEAKAIKDKGYTIYTIGVHSDTLMGTANNRIDIPTFLRGLSSDYPSATQMEDVYGTLTTASYELASLNIGSYARRSGGTDTNWRDVSGYYVKVDDNYYPLQVKATRTGTYRYTHTFAFQYVMPDGTAHAYTNSTLEKYSISSSILGSPSGSISNQFYQYVESGGQGFLPAAANEYYKEAAKAEELMDAFPTIINKETSTILENQYLTAGSIIRDIMHSGFVLTDHTKINVDLINGKWNGDAMSGTITWGSKDDFADYSVADYGGLANLDRPDNSLGEDGLPKQKIQIYNTNPKNHYNPNNPTAPHTVDITGIDYNTIYFGVEVKDGEVVARKESQKVVVDISHVEATNDVEYRQKVLTNHEQSGFWAPMDQNGVRSLVGTFPLPDTYFTDATFVMDYAKHMELPLEELQMAKADSSDISGMHFFAQPVEKEAGTNGFVNIKDGKLSYQPSTMNLNGYDSFYIFGETETGSPIREYEANRTGNLWSKVNVIPANNLYYEDTFVTNEENGIVGIEYSGEWLEIGTGSNIEKPESMEQGENGAGIHGWEEALADDEGYSDGTAYVSNTAGAKATFTFTGTGVDVYSRTNMTAGSIFAYIYAGDKAEGKPLRSLVVDNLSASGDYYQVPTLSFHDQYKLNADGTKVTYQDEYVFEPLPYGTYTIKLIVNGVKDDPDFDGNKTVRSTYYLDGIRVYNPIQNAEAVDSTIRDVYDKEVDAVFENVRDILIDASNAGSELTGPVFIDRVLTETDDDNDGQADEVTKEDGAASNVIGTYQQYGPKNEVYLDQGQAISFFAPGNSSKHFYIGLKSLTGEPVTVQVYKDGKTQEFEVSHTTDMYYEITPDMGKVMISNAAQNTGSSESTKAGDSEEPRTILAVTKLKITGADIAQVFLDNFEAVEPASLLSFVNRSDQDVVEPEVPEGDVDSEEPEDSKEPEVSGRPNVEIQNPTRKTIAKNFADFIASVEAALQKIKEKLFGDIYTWFS